MSKKSFKKYCHKHVDAVISLLKKPNEALTVADFHHLRVEIKKIRALIVMLNFSVKTFNSKKISKPIEKIFNQAGKVRMLQLEAAMIKKHDPKRQLKTYSRMLHEKEIQEKKIFSVIHAEVKSTLKKNFRKIIQVTHKIHEGQIIKYVSRKKNEIITLTAQETLKTSQIHKLRKRLKRLYYNLKSLDQKDNIQTFKNCEALLDLMGKWHDSRVMNRHLMETADKHFIASSEIEHVLQIAGKLYSKSQILFREINKEKRKKIV